jgi:hypothetical protein
LHLAVVSPFLDRQHGTELCITEQIERLARRDHWTIRLYAQKVSQLSGVHPKSAITPNELGPIRWHRVADITGPRMLPQKGALALFLLCPYCDTPPPLRLWMEMGLSFGMVEQSQADKLAMPLLRSAALLLRKRLSRPAGPRRLR